MSGQTGVILERDGLRITHDASDGFDNCVVSLTGDHTFSGAAVNEVRKLQGVHHAYISRAKTGATYLFYCGQGVPDKAALAGRVIDAINGAQG